MVNRKARLDHNTFIVDIPKKIAIKFGMQHRETVDVSFEDNTIVIRKINRNEPQRDQEAQNVV